MPTDSPKISPISPVGEQPPASNEVRLTSATTSAGPAKTGHLSSDAKPVAATKTTTFPGLFRDISIHYQVDPETKRVSVLLVDKKSHKVIRTVPPEELARLGIDHTFEGEA